MATINFSFSVPDDKVQDILNTVTTYKGYTDTVLDENGDTIPNPETRTQYLRRMVREELKAWYINGKGAEVDIHRIEAVNQANQVSIV